MAFSLILNSSNVIGANNNTLQYNFLGGSFKVEEGAEISIASMQIPYSWYNVASYYNNQSFQIIFPNTASATYNLTLPAGFYSVVDIQNYIQQFCLSNALYLIDNLGNYVYYIYLSYNTSAYKIQLLTYAVPSSLPSGYSTPTGWAGFPASPTSSQLIVLNNNFQNIIGFKNGTYPATPSSTSVSTLSTFTPVGSNVNSLVVRCSLVNNSCIIPSDILDTILITGAFGSNINYNPSFQKWVKMKPGNYNNLIITINDQNLNTLYALDSNIVINLLINPAPKK